MVRTVANGAVMRMAPFPNDLVQEVLRTEYSIQQEFEVMTCRGVTVEIERTALLQDSSKFDKPRGHHRQVREHIRVAKKQPEGLQYFRNLPACLYHLIVGGACGLVPLPSVFKGVDLRGCASP